MTFPKSADVILAYSLNWKPFNIIKIYLYRTSLLMSYLWKFETANDKHWIIPHETRLTLRSAIWQDHIQLKTNISGVVIQSGFVDSSTAFETQLCCRRQAATVRKSQAAVRRWNLNSKVLMREGNDGQNCVYGPNDRLDHVDFM